jgi:hypothetical protein
VEGRTETRTRTCLLDVPRVDFDCTGAVTGVCGACRSLGSGTASWIGDSGIGSLSGRFDSLMTWSRMKWQRAVSETALPMVVTSGCCVSITLGVAGFGWSSEWSALSHFENAATYI